MLIQDTLNTGSIGKSAPPIDNRIGTAGMNGHEHLATMVHLTPITDPFKLEEYYRFRFRIYHESALKSMVTHADGMDKDRHDDRAHHYGWYVDGTLVGCVRFVEPEPGHDALPMLAYMEGEPAGIVRGYITERAAQGQPMIEASRFCLAPERRGLRTARDFVLSMVMTMQPRGFEHGLFDCDINHAPFYQLLGFEDIQGKCGFQVPGHGTRSTTMSYHYERVLSAVLRYNAGQGFRGRWEMKPAA